MVTELQFAAIAVFLIWCLVSSLCGVLTPEPEPARLVWRERGSAGWGKWREVYFGLTAADRRILAQPEAVHDDAEYAALVCTVRHQAKNPESDAIQFAVVRMSPEDARATVVFVSDHVAVKVAVGAGSPDRFRS